MNKNGQFFPNFSILFESFGSRFFAALNHGRSSCKSVLSAYHSDHPGLSLVSHVLNDEHDNYASWCRSMLIALGAKNKIGFIDGSILPPAENAPNYSLWLRNNNLVSSWILNSVSKELTASIVYSATALEIWRDLQERFMQNNGPRMFQLRKDFITCTQGDLSVGSYYSKIKGLWEELAAFRPMHTCVYGGVQPLTDHVHREYVLTFLMGLNDDFNNVRGQILLMDSLPNIGRVYSLVVQDEKQRDMKTVRAANQDPHFKTDKAYILREAINYVKQLQERVKELENQNKRKKGDSVTVIKKSKECTDEETNSCDSGHGFKKPLPKVEARVLEKEILIAIHCEKQKDIVLRLMALLQNLHLSVASSSVLPFGTSTLKVTIIAQMEDEYCMTVNDLVKNLRQDLLESHDIS